MKKIRVVTNKTFENYIDYLNTMSNKRRYGKKYEATRWDNLEIDDVTPNIKAPSDSEVDAAVRNLDLFDDVAAEVGAKDIEVDDDGKLRILDLDPNGKKVRKKRIGKDNRFATLELDDDPDTGKTSSNQEDDKVRELDFDDKGANVKSHKSNLATGINGVLDIDGVDTSKLVATIADVYACLSSDDPEIVKSTIKRYAGDITDSEEIKKAMLVQAKNLNLNCLKPLCGDMKITIQRKEKELYYIDRKEIAEALARFKSIASKLTGENNTYGLIPNAIVSCTPDNQTACINVVDFLHIWCELPIMPVYVRGAMIRHCYQLSEYLLDTIGGVLPTSVLSDDPSKRAKGLITRMGDLDDVPKQFCNKIADVIVNNRAINAKDIGKFVISLIKNNNKTLAKKVLNDLSVYKRDAALDYIEQNDYAAQEVVSKFKFK